MNESVLKLQTVLTPSATMSSPVVSSPAWSWRIPLSGCYPEFSETPNRTKTTVIRMDFWAFRYTQSHLSLKVKRFLPSCSAEITKKLPSGEDISNFCGPKVTDQTCFHRQFLIRVMPISYNFEARYFGIEMI